MPSHEEAPDHSADSSSNFEESASQNSQMTTPSSSETLKSSESTEPGVDQIADPTANPTTMPTQYHEYALPSPLVISDAISHVDSAFHATHSSYSPHPSLPAPSHQPSQYAMPPNSPSAFYHPPTYTPYTHYGSTLPPETHTSHHFMSPPDWPSLPSPIGQPSYPYISAHDSETSDESTVEGIPAIFEVSGPGQSVFTPISASPSNPSSGPPNLIDPDFVGHTPFTSSSAAPPVPLDGPHSPQSTSVPSSSGQPPQPSSPSNHWPSGSAFGDHILHHFQHHYIPHPEILAQLSAWNASHLAEFQAMFAGHQSQAMSAHTRYPPRSPNSLASVLRFIEGLPKVAMEDLDDQHRTCGICWGDYGDEGASFKDSKAESPLRLPCSHVFGSGCLEVYLKPVADNGWGKHICPTCRREIRGISEGSEST